MITGIAVVNEVVGVIVTGVYMFPQENYDPPELIKVRASPPETESVEYVIEDR